MQAAITPKGTILSGTPEEIVLYSKLAALAEQITIKPRFKNIVVDVEQIIKEHLKENQSGGGENGK